MVRGRTSNRVGDALSRMLEGSKPRQAGHVATAGEQVSPLAHAPQPSPSPSPRSSQTTPGGSTPAGGDAPLTSPPAPRLVWDREKEEEAIRQLLDEGEDIFTAMEITGSWDTR